MEEEKIEIKPGECFGWYSTTACECADDSCLRSEWCKNYSLNRANEAEKSIKKSLEEVGEDSSNKIKESGENKEIKKEKQKQMEDFGRQTFFEKVVSFVAENVEQDNIKYNPKKTTASIKIGGKVVVFLAKKKNSILVKMGGRGKESPTMKVSMGELIEEQLKSFLDESTDEDN